MPFIILRLLRRRRNRLAKVAKTTRNVAFARAALSLLQTRIARRLPGAKPAPIVTPVRAAIAGGALAGIAGLGRSLRSRETDDDGARTAPGPAPVPAPANVDVPRPPQQPFIPAAGPVEPAGIDEEAEIAAAAAEARAIGGTDETPEGGSATPAP